MARAVNRLSARRVQTLDAPGRHADGGGLYLVVDDGGAKRWAVLYRLNGRRREMGLGSVLAVPLARARELAADARAAIAEGRDPIEARRAPPPSPARPTTFADVALAYMADREATWRNAKHRAQWRSTLEVGAASLWSKPVAAVSTDDVLAALRPIWSAKPETGRRIRGRIERVLDAARAAGHRSGENPARWRGHLDAILPRSRKLSRGHHTAMPYADVPAFMAALRARPGLSARALEVLVLTASRSGEVRGMLAGEVDAAAAVWTVPAARMKGGRTHRVPLSPAALAILRERVEGLASGDPVFPGPLSGKPMSDMVWAALLRRMKQGAFTAHGFRSAFRDWAGEATGHPRELAELALAHLIGDETERAYWRGDALERRRALMDDWAAFCASMKA